MKFSVSNLPKEEGFYFVKTKKAQYWQCLIYLKGKVPFLKVTNVKTLFKTSDEGITTGDLTELDWSEVMILNNINLTKLESEALELIREEKKLAAVKHVKDTLSWGLKEAKDFCDNLQDTYLR